VRVRVRGGKRGESEEEVECLVEEGKKQRRRPENCKRSQTSLANPLQPTVHSLPHHALLLQKDVRVHRRPARRCEIPSFISTYLNFLTTVLRQSPHLRNQLGLSSSNRGPHTPPPLLNLLIRSAGLQTSRAISPRSPPRRSFFPLFPSQNFPVHPNLSGTSFCFMLTKSRWLADSVLV
jgi:hypothetical protein